MSLELLHSYVYPCKVLKIQICAWQASDVTLEDIFDLCPILEEMSWQKMLVWWHSAPHPSDPTAPINFTHLLRMRVLLLREGLEWGSLDFFTSDEERGKELGRRGQQMSNWSVNGAVVASLLLAAPLLERVFLDRVCFEASAVEALTAAVCAGTALQRMRIVCINTHMCRKEIRPLLDVLLQRMREFCPRLEYALVSHENEILKQFWSKHFINNFRPKEFA